MPKWKLVLLAVELIIRFFIELRTYAVPPYLVLSSSVDPFFVTVILMSTVYFIISYRILLGDASFILYLLIIDLPTCVVVWSASLLNLIKVLCSSVLPQILIQ